jgi:hypothetical protein
MANRDTKGRFAPTVPGVEVSKAAKLPSGVGVNTRPLGNTGLKRANGYIEEEFLQELRGAQGARTISEMRNNDPVIGSMFFAIEMFLRKVEWFVDPDKEEDPDSEEKAKFLRECKEDMKTTWPDFISETVSFLEHGWCWEEILYKRRTTQIEGDRDSPPSKYNDGKIGWKEFQIRSQDSLDEWEFDDDGNLQGMWQMAAPDYTRKYIPIQKSLLFRTQIKKNNPEGRSILRNAYRPWYFKKRMEEIEGVGVERDLAGLPFAEVPAEMMADNASEADKATLASIVELLKNVRRDQQEGVVWPQSWNSEGVAQYNFKLMNSGGTRQFNTDTIITRYEQRIAMVVLADFLLLGNDSAGSFALATSKTGMFQAALSAWLDVIQDVLNNYAVPRLFRLNNIEGPFPKFRHDKVQKPALADVATFISALAGAGAQLFPDIDLENHFRRMADLPLRDQEKADTEKENELRDAELDSKIAGARAAMRLAENPPEPAAPGTPGSRPSTADQRKKPGAPTKSTGKVKSKLPPQSRRRTKAVNASENVGKRRVVIVKRSK